MIMNSDGEMKQKPNQLGSNENYLENGIFYPFSNSVTLMPCISPHTHTHTILLLPAVQKVTKNINWEMSE